MLIFKSYLYSNKELDIFTLRFLERIKMTSYFVKVKLAASYVNKADLRRSAIHLLQSMLTLPLHFNNMPIKVLTAPYIVSKFI